MKIVFAAKTALSIHGSERPCCEYVRGDTAENKTVERGSDVHTAGGENTEAELGRSFHPRCLQHFTVIATVEKAIVVVVVVLRWTMFGTRVWSCLATAVATGR